MSFLSKVAMFSGFFLFFVGFLIASQAALSWSSSPTTSAKVPLPLGQPTYRASTLSTYRASTLLSLVYASFLFGSIWMLSGFFDLVLVFAFVFVAQLSLLLQYALAAIFTRPNLEWVARKSCFFWETLITHRIALGFFSILIIISPFLLPIACGFAYFGNEVPSDHATKQIFTVMFGWILPAAVLALVIIMIPYICSQNVDAENRLRAVSGQFAGLGSTVFFLAVLFWSLEISDQSSVPLLERNMLSISPLLMTTLLVYACITLIGPFLVGSRRAAMWQHDLSQRQQSWLGKLVEILRNPIPASYLPKLDDLSVDILRTRDQFIADDKYIAWIFDGTREPTIDPDKRQQVLSNVEKCRRLDPRLRYIDFLEEMLGLIKETRAELVRIEGEKEKKERAGDFAAVYKQKASEEAEKESVERKAIVSLGPSAAFVVGALMTAAIGKIGEWAVLRAFGSLQ